MDETSKGEQEQRLGHFDDIVDWCRSNGFTDFDFEGLERRVLEIATTLGAGPRASGDSTSSDHRRRGRLVSFRPIARKRLDASSSVLDNKNRK